MDKFKDRSPRDNFLVLKSLLDARNLILLPSRLLEAFSRIIRAEQATLPATGNSSMYI
jgi:hypothetical protein